MQKEFVAKMLHGDHPAVGMQGLSDGQGIAGIQKSMTWKIYFFIGSCCVLASAVIAILYFTIHFQWAPCTFTSQLFLLVFGLMMLVLDFPIPHPSPMLQRVRENIYKFCLFMTRFTGRGMWYTFLSTMCFVALWDENISLVFGLVFPGYLLALGAIALYKGVKLSRTLNSVRGELLQSPNTSSSTYFSQNHTVMSKDQFKQAIDSIVAKLGGNHEPFSDDDLDYIINALSFKATNDGQVSVDEWNYWMRQGTGMLMV